MGDISAVILSQTTLNLSPFKFTFPRGTWYANYNKFSKRDQPSLGMYLVYKDTIKIWGRGLASAPVIRFYLPFVLPFIVGLCPSPLGSTSDGTPPACCHCTYPLPSRSSACHSLLLLYPPPCHCCIPPPPRHFHPRHHVTPFFAVVVLPSPSSSCHSPHRGFDALHVLPMGCIHWV